MKVGFLFGAGAEVGYGLPSGGKFALDIFRQDSSKSKADFKTMRSCVNSNTTYAADWLPDGYLEKSINSFGKKVFETIIKDTIEHRRDDIVIKLNKFDEIAKETIKYNKMSAEDINNAIKELTGQDYTNISMKQTISFVDAFVDGNDLFANKYFSSFLAVYKKINNTDAELKKKLGKIILSIMQLQVGALSERLSRRINDGLFNKKDDDIDLFDDMGDIIQLNYQSAGISGLEYLLENEGTSKSSSLSNTETVIFFAEKVIESIYASVLDYKSLIDANWHSLYCPKSEWAKFCKISIFLLTVKDYIKSKAAKIPNDATDGYYHDLKNAISNGKIEVSGIATTNYNSFISDVLSPNEISYMNGSTEEWYDPYLNKLGKKEDLDKKENHFLVPLLFTQSGTKPMTAIEMTLRYSDLYKKFKETDKICIVGFGFNADDEHINGLFRSLIEDEHKKIVIVEKRRESTEDEVHEKICHKLKILSTDNIEVILVNDNRCTSDETIWIRQFIDN